MFVPLRQCLLSDEESRSRASPPAPLQVCVTHTSKQRPGFPVSVGIHLLPEVLLRDFHPDVLKLYNVWEFPP